MHLQISFVDCSSVIVSKISVDGGLLAYVVSLLGLPETNVLGSHAQDIAIGIDDTGTGTAGTDIDS